MRKIYSTLILSLIVIVAFAQIDKPRANTKNGILEGVYQSGIKVFKGIPFAEPPVGELRWKEPQPVRNWDGVRKAIQFGPNAMQLNVFGDMNFGTDQMSEDCLYLNVWTPAKSMKEKLPVLVYFHGGGLIGGSGSEPRYAGEPMARRGIVSITANYRLGIFGFFAHPDLTKESPNHASGNYGFLDQVAALRWIKDNISNFGGDPNRITIAGESAGSMSVSALMCSPLSKKLFEQAIGSSGSIMSTYKTIVSLSEAEKEGEDLVKANNCNSIAEMRNISGEKLVKQSPLGIPTFSVDGYFLPKPPVEIFANGEQAHIPLLAGWNSLEAPPMLFTLGQAPTLENFSVVAKSTFGDKTDQVLKLYNITDEASFTANGTDLSSDMFIAYSTWKWCDIHKKTGGKQVYRYRYNHSRPAMVSSLGDKTAGLAGGVMDNGKDAAPKLPVIEGAPHSADIEYAMGTLPTNRVFNWQPEDYFVSEIFQNYYINFIKTGNPNGLGLPEWNPFEAKDEAPILQIQVNTYEKVNKELEARYRFLDKIYFPAEWK